MEPADIERAVAAAMAEASAHGLDADDAVVVHNSNRIAVHLAPCDVLARVAPLIYQAPDNDLELRVAHALAQAGGPVAEPDPRVEPRVHVRDGFAVTLWTYYEPATARALSPAEYAGAVAGLHAGMRRIDVETPHFMDRVGEALTLLADESLTPDLVAADRALLDGALRELSAEVRAGAREEQLLHGEPHVGNVLRTRRGLLFIDFETCCRGPVEFDIAHGLLPNEDGEMLPADAVGPHYPGADLDVIDRCRTLIWAMITTWRWRWDDQLPNRHHWRVEGLARLRAALHARAGGRSAPGP